MPPSRARPTPMTSLFARLQNPDTAAVDVCDRCRRVVVSASSTARYAVPALRQGPGALKEGGRSRREESAPPSGKTSHRYLMSSRGGGGGTALRPVADGVRWGSRRDCPGAVEGGSG